MVRLPRPGPLCRAPLSPAVLPRLGRATVGALLALTLSGCALLGQPQAPFRPEVARDVLAAPATERLRVIAMGDQGTGTATQWAVARGMGQVCEANGCDLGLGLGDNFYPAGPREARSPLFGERFAAPYGPLKIPFLMVTGNHDESLLWGGDGADARSGEVQVGYARTNPQWVMPGRTYRAPLGPLLEVFAVATSPLAAALPPLRAGERPGGGWARAQQAWLTGALSGSAARWKLVLGHHPLFSNGKHGDAGRYDGLPWPLQRGDAVSALYGVACGQADLILSGHDHALQLFAPQAGCPATWTAVSGAAGKTDPRGSGQRPAAFELYGQPGFLWLEVTPQALEVRAYTVSADGQATLAATQTIRKP